MVRQLLFITSGLVLTAIASPPAVPAPEGDDPAARALLREAYERRETWTGAFPGFEAGLTLTIDGTAHAGKVRVARGGMVAVTMDDEAAKKRAESMLQSIVVHRASSPFEQNEGRYALTFGPGESGKAGRLIQVGDETRSTYRVRDREMVQISRMAGPKLRFTIDILSSQSTDAGKVLPRVYTVTYRDAATGELNRVDTFVDRYRKVGSFYLPEERKVVESGRERSTSYSLELTAPGLLSSR